MKERVKTQFTWDDLNDPKLIIPCLGCLYIDAWETCDDGATSSACNHCAYNIISYCRDHNV